MSFQDVVVCGHGVSPALNMLYSGRAPNSDWKGPKSVFSREKFSKNFQNPAHFSGIKDSARIPRNPTTHSPTHPLTHSPSLPLSLSLSMYMCICIYIGTAFLFAEGPPRHFSFGTLKTLKMVKNLKNCPKTPKTALFPSRNLLVGIESQNTDPLQNLSKLTRFWPFWTVFGVSLRKHGRLYRVPLTKTGEAYFGPKLTSGNDFFDHFWALFATFGHFLDF